MNQYGLSESTMKTMVSKISIFPQIDSAVIFGSRAMGNYKKGSDIDIALFGQNISYEIVLDISSELNERTNQPYFFDLVSYDSIDNADLRAHIQQYGKNIFSRTAASQSSSSSS